MLINERFIMSKSGAPDSCEDMIVTSDSFIALIDGVTSKSRKEVCGVTSGRFAAQCIADALKAADFSLDAYRLLSYISASLARRSSAAGFQYDEIPGASLLLFNAARMEIIRYGDCTFFIGDKLYRHEKETDTVLSKKRADYINKQLNEGASTEDFLTRDTGREYILPLLIKQTEYANRPGKYGYAVCDGSPPAECFIEVFPVASGNNIVFLSDGYPFPALTLSENEKALSYLLENDPLCINLYPSTKGLVKGNASYDDRSYISFTA